MESRLTFIIICLWLAGCQPQADSFSPTGQPYFGLVPTDSAQKLFPGWISTSASEYNASFSPDGKTFYYTFQIPGRGSIVSISLDDNGVWQQPEVASFSGIYSEYDPLFAPDGTLFFSSERPVDSTDQAGKAHIWQIDPTTRQPTLVQLSDTGDYHSSIAASGAVYYNTWSTGEILKAVPTDSGYVSTPLPAIINEGSDVGDPFIAPDESYLIFRAYYEGGMGRGDLYISFQENGAWSKPQNLGPPINSPQHEMCPVVTADGKIFLFASNRMTPYQGHTLSALTTEYHSAGNGFQDIYYISPDFIHRLKETSSP